MKTKKAENKTDPELASNTLRIVPINNAFYFFTDIGRYTDRCSACLADFCNAIQVIDVKSVEFHFKRGDFEWWIRDTLRDEYLANKIGRIDKSIQGEALRSEIQGIVRLRISTRN